MSPKTFNVRAATPADEPGLGELGAMLVRRHHDFDARRFLAPSANSAQEYGAFLVGELAKPQTVVMAATDADGRISGYAYGALEGMDWLSLRGPAGVIYDLIVDPGQRGRGLGRRLLLETIAQLEAMGAPQLMLFAAHQNEDAQRLFSSVGFRPTMVEMTRERQA